ncbi:hypothetical protein GOP47_0015412, partial [Adiantum capillus-veneris]
MEKKKARPQSSSSSEESSSGDEEENEQEFVMSDRKAQMIDDKKAPKADEDSESEEDEEEGDEDESEDDDDEEIDGTQRVKVDEASSSEDEQHIHGEGGADSDSEMSSPSDSKPSKPSLPFVVLPRKVENANGHNGKKAPTIEMPSRTKQELEASPKKSKDKVLKRDRDEPLVAEKGSSKKPKKESSDISGKNVEHVPKAKDSEKLSKDKNVTAITSEKKSDSKKSAHATTIAEKPEDASAQKNSAKKPESSSAKKTGEKPKNDKKSTKNSDTELAKGSLSPVKHKLFTGKDEIVLTKEILHDLQKGIEIPSRKTDGYWSDLANRVEGRMDGLWSKEKLCEKLKRMKNRYAAMAEKFNSIGERKFRKTIDQELFSMWDQIWGNEDATKADDTDDGKNKHSKALSAASPVKGAKASRNKVAAPVHDVKVVIEESEAHKEEDNGDVSETEESNGGSDSPKKELTITPVGEDAHMDQIMVLEEKNADNTLSHSVSEVQSALHKEVRATLTEIQESSRQMLKEWQTKALAVVENAVKAVAHQARFMNGL